jgi:hypothetical protein
MNNMNQYSNQVQITKVEYDVNIERNMLLISMLGFTTIPYRREEKKDNEIQKLTWVFQMNK